MLPELLPPNPIEHFYLGGDRIAQLRGFAQRSDRQPEEWLGATVSRFGGSAEGLAATAGGALLRDLVAADPEGWLGSPGYEPGDTGILVKLLDARQRLPVHVHPSRGFAAAHLDCPYGKTEAWVVLDSVDDGAVYIGWNQDVDPDELDRRREAQDSEWLLSRMNRVSVTPGMGILCPAGQVHAIGEGVFVAEVQEPTDFSILLEWSVTTSTREESHLDLGFESAMRAVSTTALLPEDIEALICRVGQDPASGQPESLLPSQADPFFRVLRARGSAGVSAGAFPQSFAVVLATGGAGRLVSEAGEVPIASGEAYAVPRAFGAWRLDGDVTVLALLPGVGWPETLGAGESSALFMGEVLMEAVHKGGAVEEFVGGGPANAAVGLSRLGHRASLLTCVGHDPYGERIAAFLEQQAVTLLPESWKDFPSASVIATIDDEGSPSYDFTMRWEVSDFDPGEFNLVHAGSLGLFLEPGGSRVVELLRHYAGRAIISVDPNVRPLMLPDHGVALRRFEDAAGVATVVKLSDEDAEWLYPALSHEEAMHHIRGLGVKIVVLTLGADGAVALGDAGAVRVPAYAAEVVDTISAGDSFLASLLASLLERGHEMTLAELEEVLQRAASAAAIAVSVAGPNPPTREALAQFLGEQ